jgi:hypothetical protein
MVRLDAEAETRYAADGKVGTWWLKRDGGCGSGLFCGKKRRARGKWEKEKVTYALLLRKSNTTLASRAAVKYRRRGLAVASAAQPGAALLQTCAGGQATRLLPAPLLCSVWLPEVRTSSRYIPSTVHAEAVLADYSASVGHLPAGITTEHHLFPEMGLIICGLTHGHSVNDDHILAGSGWDAREG